MQRPVQAKSQQSAFIDINQKKLVINAKLWKCSNIEVYQKCFLPKGGKGYVWAENKIDYQIMLLHIALKYNALKENFIAKQGLLSFIDVFGFWILVPFSVS